MRVSVLAVLAGIGVCVGSAAASAQSTIRIEPRPFYGATVTLEAGVRVFRPLPPHERVIINPNKTPLYLGFEDRRIVSYSENHNYGTGDAAVYGGAPGLFVGSPRFHRFVHRRGHGHGGRAGHR
ncbi:MAG TPA: hypothetical protein VG900_00530 [Hyphomicrobiaceae bacterium]|jgi:hypothetical protein|nr:hypothetical protein [Hyphomicrobiaceae bacterium]